MPSVPIPAAAGSGGEAVLALAATYLLEDDRTADALFALNQASGPADFLAAAHLAWAPQQNVFYADRDGHIGWIAAERIPTAPGLRVPARRRLDGRLRLGWIPAVRGPAAVVRSAHGRADQRQQPSGAGRLAVADQRRLGRFLPRRTDRTTACSRHAAVGRRRCRAAARSSR